MQLLLIRHGQPRRAKCRGEDPGLTALGESQAHLVAARMVSERPDCVVASHLTRARLTAQPTAELLNSEIQTEPKIAEVDADSSVGYVHIDDLRNAGGETWQAFLADPIVTLGGEECSFRARVLEGFNDILKTYADTAKVVVFTHGFPINVLLGHVLNYEELTRFIPAHGSITRVDGTDLNKLSVTSINETTHFPAGAW